MKIDAARPLATPGAAGTIGNYAPLAAAINDLIHATGSLLNAYILLGHQIRALIGQDGISSELQAARWVKKAQSGSLRGQIDGCPLGESSLRLACQLAREEAYIRQVGAASVDAARKAIRDRDAVQKPQPEKKPVEAAAKAAPVEDAAMWKARAEAAEKEAAQYSEMVERASKRNSELIKERDALKAKATAPADADAVVDPATLSMSAQQKLDACKRQEVKKLQAVFEEAVRQRVAESVERAEKRLLDGFIDRFEHAEKVIEGYRGVMTKEEYNLIRACLHPDSRANVSEERLAKAFLTFNSKEIRLLPASQTAPKAPPLPATVEELLKRRASA